MYHSTPLIHPCNLYNYNYNTLMYFEPLLFVIILLLYFRDSVFNYNAIS